MAITFLQQRKKQQYLIVIFILLILATFVILWTNLFQKEEKTTSPEAYQPKTFRVNINLEVLENPILQELQPFEKIAPFEGEVGRENPFLPYFE